MPLTKFQAQIAQLLATNRDETSHLAGAAAIHIAPQSLRYSNDLDYFHDSDVRVAEAFEADRQLLEFHSYNVEVLMQQPGFIRSLIRLGQEATKLEWAHDSAWRFMPVQKHSRYGYLLHPIDLSINKVLTLAGREEPRDLIDVLYVHEKNLTLGSLVWAAVGKDPGFNPHSLLELLKRRGKIRPEDLQRLKLSKELRLEEIKTKWLGMLDDAEGFIANRPPEEVGCLYYCLNTESFFTPSSKHQKNKDYVLHYGRPGGVLPQLK